MFQTLHLGLLDLGVMLAYFAGLLGAVRIGNRHSHKAREHFLAGNSANWLKVGFSLYASTISAVTLVGLTGSAYAHGISVFNYEWVGAVVLTVFCAFVLPTYIRNQVFTVPEFLELRYGRFVRTYVSGLSIVLGTFVDAAGMLFAGAMLFHILVPDWPLWWVCVGLALLAGGFLITGGLRAVISIESIQGVVMVIACACIAYFTFEAAGKLAGGWQAALARVDPSHLKLINPASDPIMPWTGLVTGVPLIGFYFWCTNQTMVQRVLAARSLDDGRWGSLLGGALKLTSLFLVVLPGAAVIVLLPQASRPDEVFSHIVFKILPSGLTGLVVAACLISILSGLAGTYNATSTLLTMDFIKRLRPDITEQGLVRTGQITTLVLMALSILWVPQIIHFKDTLWQYLQAILCYFVPPIAAVFICGLFIRRANRTGAAAALILGTATSFILFFGVEVLHVVPLHFLIAAIVIFAASMAAMLIGSLLSPPQAYASLEPLMFSKRIWAEETAHLKTVKWYQNYRFLSIGLLLLTAGVVLAFF
jgi:solute:Na+ symporter, SSS family